MNDEAGAWGDPLTADGRAIWDAISTLGPIGISDLHFSTLLPDAVIRDHIRLNRHLYACITTWMDGFPLRRYTLAPLPEGPTP